MIRNDYIHMLNDYIYIYIWYNILWYIIDYYIYIDYFKWIPCECSYTILQEHWN